MITNSNIEIERKFLVKSLPPHLEQYPKYHIEQGYISIDSSGAETRLRSKDGRYFLTIKTGNGLTRTEHEIELTAEQFKTLWPTTKGRRLEKRRYILPGKIELDIYNGLLTGLVVAELEFQSETESLEFKPPHWFGQEVTYNKGYKNQSLATRGAPKL